MSVSAISLIDNQSLSMGSAGVADGVLAGFVVGFTLALQYTALALVKIAAEIARADNTLIIDFLAIEHILLTPVYYNSANSLKKPSRYQKYSPQEHIP